MNIRSGRSRGVLKPALALGALAAALTAVLVGSASAAQGPQPTIVGSPIVGQTLLATPSGGAGTNYKWQRCNPATASPSCFNAGENDSDYTTILAGNGRDSYTLTSADLGHFIRVQTKGAPHGDQWIASDPVGPVVAPAGSSSSMVAQGSITPIHGIQFLAQETEGNVKYKPPGQKKFKPLVGLAVIPNGSIINAKKGHVVVIAAIGQFGNQTPDNSVEFWEGVFKINQKKKANARAVAKLLGKLSCKNEGGKSSASAASGGPEAVTSARRKRRLWGRGSGRYRTRGRGGTGSVRGTKWLTKDTCKGTFFNVPKKGNDEGSGITVNPKKKGKKNVFLGPGEKYFAAL